MTKANTLAAQIMELNSVEEITGISQASERATLRAELALLVAQDCANDVCEDGLLEDGLFETMTQAEQVEDYRQAFGFYQFGNAKKVYPAFFTSVIDEPRKAKKKLNKKVA